jgi:hypothetical protein
MMSVAPIRAGEGASSAGEFACGGGRGIAPILPHDRRRRFQLNTSGD